MEMEMASLSLQKSLLDQDSDVESEASNEDIQGSQLFHNGFDFYRKGNAAASTGAIRFFANETRSVVFPSRREEMQRAMVDEYGQALMADEVKDTEAELDDLMLDVPKVEIHPLDLPARYNISLAHVDVACLVKYIDFEGNCLDVLKLMILS